MNNFIVKLFTFILIILACAVQAGTIDIDYDFEYEELLINTSCTLGSYNLTLYRTSYIGCIEHSEIIKSEALSDFSGGMTIIENVPLGKYKVIFTGPDVLKKEVYLGLASERTKVSWCLVEHNLPVWYNIYVKNLQTQEYESGTFIDVGNTTEYDFDYLSAHVKYFMYVTATDGVDESKPSNEAIMYVVLPTKLKSIVLE